MLAQRNLPQEESSKVRADLIEALGVAGRNEHAGDVLAEASKDDAESMAEAFDYYVRGNAFQKAIMLAERTGQ